MQAITFSQVKISNILYAQEPEGEFVLPDSNRPVALISAGIGITPMVSMLHTLTQQSRQVYFIHRTSIHLEYLFSQPLSQDERGINYDRKGHITIDLLQECIPELNADFLICGPKGFTADIIAQLIEHGVDEKYIQTEDFK